MTHDDLLNAIQSLNAEDAFRPRLDPGQWRTFLQYLTRHEVRAGDLLLKQGELDRTVYFVGQGMLQVYVTGGAPGTNKIGILRAGSMVGEPGLFADGERTANVEAMTTAVVWALRLPRFEELCARIPVIALEVLRAAGSVMALRMRANMTRQTPVT
jgi:CRP/FNR family cyclic AMP-dependent transcriptional regulator